MGKRKGVKNSKAQRGRKGFSAGEGESEAKGEKTDKVNGKSKR